MKRDSSLLRRYESENSFATCNDGGYQEPSQSGLGGNKESRDEVVVIQGNQEEPREEVGAEIKKSGEPPVEGVEFYRG
jgi:hypothetical protein